MLQYMLVHKVWAAEFVGKIVVAQLSVWIEVEPELDNVCTLPQIFKLGLFKQKFNLKNLKEGSCLFSYLHFYVICYMSHVTVMSHDDSTMCMDPVHTQPRPVMMTYTL
jgi:hypothetical protein